MKEDQDLKIKMANEYDMLSFVGSDIDEVKMDHLTFFKIFHQGQLLEDQPLDYIFETDPAISSLKHAFPSQDWLPLIYNSGNLKINAFFD